MRCTSCSPHHSWNPNTGNRDSSFGNAGECSMAATAAKQAIVEESILEDLMTRKLRNLMQYCPPDNWPPCCEYRQKKHCFLTPT
ncbi:MAG: hypothetical protein IPJ53_00110 [Saprospiraceae bacterium]|nr:hypothetical protein [Candidatus Vicinibacter affinis]